MTTVETKNLQYSKDGVFGRDGGWSRVKRDVDQLVKVSELHMSGRVILCFPVVELLTGLLLALVLSFGFLLLSIVSFLHCAVMGVAWDTYAEGFTLLVPLVLVFSRGITLAGMILILLYPFSHISDRRGLSDLRYVVLVIGLSIAGFAGCVREVFLGWLWCSFHITAGKTYASVGRVDWSIFCRMVYAMLLALGTGFLGLTFFGFAQVTLVYVYTYAFVTHFSDGKMDIVDQRCVEVRAAGKMAVRAMTILPLDFSKVPEGVLRDIFVVLGEPGDTRRLSFRRWALAGDAVVKYALVFHSLRRDDATPGDVNAVLQGRGTTVALARLLRRGGSEEAALAGLSERVMAELVEALVGAYWYYALSLGRVDGSVDEITSLLC